MAAKDPSGNSPGPNKLVSGFEVATGVALGAVIGTWIDHHHNTAPWGLVIGLTVGFIAGMYLLIKEAMRANKD